MLRVDLQGEPFLGEDELPVVGGTSPVVGPGSQFNLRTAELPVDFGIRPSGPANLIPRTVDLDVLDDPTDPLPTRQITAEYLEGPDGVVTNPGEPAVPLESLNVSVPMTSLRGVGFRGGSWEEDAVIPLTGAAATEIRGVHVPFSSQLLYPIRLATASYFGALDGGVERTTILHVTPTQHRVESVGQETAIRRVSTNLGYRLFYSDNTRQFGPNRPALSSPPTITRVEATRDGDDVVFEVAVVGDPAAGIQEVWVTYTEGEASSGTWVSLDLAQDPGDSRRWIGQLEDGAVNFTRLDFLVQAVNGVGLVARDDNFGRFYRQFGAGSTVPAEKVDTTLVLEAPVPTSGVYGTSVTVSATLAESPASSGAIEDGLPVVFTLGATTRIGATDGGVATVNLPLNAVPGDYLLVASFGGNDALNSSSASSEFAVLKANTALSVAVGANTVGVDGVDPGIVARLTDQNDFPLQDQTVFFTISGGPEGEVTKAVKTKVDGTASAGSFALPAGSYTVVARFLGEIPVDGDSFDLEDPVYNPAISSTTPFEIENGRGCPDSGASGNVSPRGFCYLTENVSGNVIARNGTLVLGAGARISGNLEQRRSGGVVILDGARVNGNVIEASDGGITIQDARVNGNVEEAGLGNVRIGEGADVRGNVSERGDGSVFVDGKVAGSVTERGSGTVELGPDGRIGGS